MKLLKQHLIILTIAMSVFCSASAMASSYTMKIVNLSHNLILQSSFNFIYPHGGTAMIAGENDWVTINILDVKTSKKVGTLRFHDTGHRCYPGENEARLIEGTMNQINPAKHTPLGGCILNKKSSPIIKAQLVFEGFSHARIEAIDLYPWTY